VGGSEQAHRDRFHVAHKVRGLGFDPDPSLVAIARRKLAAYPKTRIETGSFADLTRLVPFPSDLLMCLGNSLVHVPQDEDSRFLLDAAEALSRSGTLLLQILNYERLLREGQARSGDIALQIGFGAGLVYAAQVVVVP